MRVNQNIKESISIWFWVYLIISFIFISVLETKVALWFKISLFSLLIISLFLNNLKSKYSFRMKVLSWVLFVVLVLAFLAYAFIFFKEYKVGRIMLFLVPTIIGTYAAFLCIAYLWKIKDYKTDNKTLQLIFIIILYLTLSVSLIYLFGFLYSVSDYFQGNGLIFIKNGTKVTKFQDILFYTGTVYYGPTFGNITPEGSSRWYTLILSAFSYIVHVIILGVVIAAFMNNNKKRGIFKI